MQATCNAAVQGIGPTVGLVNCGEKHTDALVCYLAWDDVVNLAR